MLRALSRFDVATGGELLEAIADHSTAGMQRISRVLRKAVADGHAEKAGLTYRITEAGRAWLASGQKGNDMRKNDAFTVRYIYERIGDDWGWSYEIRDGKRRFRGGGWSTGRKANAEQDARDAVCRLMKGVECVA